MKFLSTEDECASRVTFHTAVYSNDSQTPHISSEAPAQYTSAWAAVAGVALVAVLVLMAVAVVESVIIWHQLRYAGFTMLTASLPGSPLCAEIILLFFVRTKGRYWEQGYR